MTKPDLESELIGLDGCIKAIGLVLERMTGEPGAAHFEGPLHYLFGCAVDHHARLRELFDELSAAADGKSGAAA